MTTEPDAPSALEFLNDSRPRPFDEADETSVHLFVDVDGLNLSLPMSDPTDQDAPSHAKMKEISHEDENGLEVAVNDRQTFAQLNDAPHADDGHINETSMDKKNDRDVEIKSCRLAQCPDQTKHDNPKDISETIMPSNTIETQKSEDAFRLVEGAYDEESGQGIKRKQPWRFPAKRRCQRLFCLLCAVFVLLAIVIGSILGAKYGGQNKSTAETTATPQSAPTSSPVPSPTNDNTLIELLRNISGSRLADPDSPQNMAASIIAKEVNGSDFFPTKMIQRYAMLTTVVSLLRGRTSSFVDKDECEWTFTTCTSTGGVRALAMARMELEGEIPPEISHLQGLTKLDLASNSIEGSLPEAFYALTALKYIYLDNNKFKGTINPSIVNMTQLEALYLGKNQFSGTIPGTLPTPLRKFLLCFLAFTMFPN